MQCAGKSLTRCAPSRVTRCVVPQQRPRKVFVSAPASAEPSLAPSSAPSESKKAAQKSPAPTTTQAVKSKKVKAPRSISAYNYFVKGNYAKFVAMHPEKKGVPELTLDISAAWLALSEKDKAPYIAAGEKSKKEVTEKRALLKAQAKAVARPINAYAQFVVDNFPIAKATNPAMNFVETSKVVRDMWASISEVEKAKLLAVQAAKLAEWKAKQNGA